MQKIGTQIFYHWLASIFMLANELLWNIWHIIKVLQMIIGLMIEEMHWLQVQLRKLLAVSLILAEQNEGTHHIRIYNCFSIDL